MNYEFYCGDALTELAKIPDKSVYTCVTSPPYFQLRDYQTGVWEGGDPACDHLRPALGGAGKEKLVGTTANENKTKFQQYSSVCKKCGAQRQDKQVGLEASPNEYVSHLVEIFREVRRVLRDNGTAWFVIGDSFADNRSYQATPTKWDSLDFGKSNATKVPSGLKPKDLIGIPWMVAFALRDDGWYLRQDIIWSKPNVMPESVKDRCTKSHEYIFLLSKSRKYYFDNDAIKEPASYPNDDRGSRTDARKGTGYNAMHGKTGEYRNKRSVWTVNTKPYKGAHFAVFPFELIEPCILAGCPEGGTVLDPFMGSGTTGMVSLWHNREFIGIELNPEYIKLAEQRVLVYK